jgi:hypothetical protein
MPRKPIMKQLALVQRDSGSGAESEEDTPPPYGQDVKPCVILNLLQTHEAATLLMSGSPQNE